MQKADESINFNFRISLQEEFTRRLRRNSRYSMRAFAGHLGIDSSSLSKILSGKRALSEEKISLLCDKIGIDVAIEPLGDQSFAQISSDTFAVISDWYHFAILDLTQIKGFKSRSEWIAKKLGIENYQASQAVDRLKRLGLLIEKNGKLIKGQSFYTNYSEGVTAAALKEYQRQVITKALHAIDECPQGRKDITGITIAADSRKLPEAKEKIKKFRRDLCAFLEDGDRDSVYHFTLQLYPVTNLDNE